MKKSLLFAAAIACACAANAEVFNYGFGPDYANFPFLGEVATEGSDYYSPGNYDLIDKYGIAMPNAMADKVLNTPDAEDKGVVAR